MLSLVQITLVKLIALRHQAPESPPSISVDDFNKNDLLGFAEKYRDEAPRIEFTYTICHLIL